MPSLDSMSSRLSRYIVDSIIQFSPDALIAVDNESRILYWNQAAEQIYGWSEAEAAGRLLCDLVGQVWQDPHDEQLLHEALASNGVWRGDCIHIRRDGSIVHVDSLVTVLRDENGNRTGQIAHNRDLSEQKAIQKRAFAAETEFRALVDSNIIGVVRVAGDDIVNVNDYFCRLLGYTNQELLYGGVHWRDLTVSEFHDVIGERLSLLTTQGYVRPTRVCIAGRTARRPAWLSGWY